MSKRSDWYGGRKNRIRPTQELMDLRQRELVPDEAQQQTIAERQQAIAEAVAVAVRANTNANLTGFNGIFL